MEIFLGFILITALVLCILLRNYEKALIKSLPKQEHPLIYYYPIVLFISDKSKILVDKAAKWVHWKQKRHHLYYKEQKRRELLQALSIGENYEKALQIHHCRKWALAFFIFLVFDLFAFLGGIGDSDNGSLKEGKYLERPESEERDVLINLTAVIRSAAGKLFTKEVEIPISSQDYTAKEAEEEFVKAEEYLDKTVLGINTAADDIRLPLNLPGKIPGSGVLVKWTSSDTKVLENNGTVHNEELTKSRIIQLTALLTLKERSVSYTRAYIIQTKIYTEEEQVVKNLNQALKEEDQISIESPRFTLPESLPGHMIDWKEEKKSKVFQIFFFGIAAAFLSIPIINNELKQKNEKRKKELLFQYPEIINKFLLLVNAGMSVSNAWIKIAEDYRGKNGVKKYAYEEMILTAGELRTGISESTAYENFGKRIKLVPYLRFSSLLSQNIRRGSAGFLEKLEEEALKSFEERKEAAKKAGEEAGTKLLVPMMLMLLLVMVLILYPAMASFQF